MFTVQPFVVKDCTRRTAGGSSEDEVGGMSLSNKAEPTGKIVVDFP